MKSLCDTVTTCHEQTKINHCAVIYDDDSDFGSVDVTDTNQFRQPKLLPSQRIDFNTLSYQYVSRTEDQTFGSVGQIFRMFF